MRASRPELFRLLVGPVSCPEQPELFEFETSGQARVSKASRLTLCNPSRFPTYIPLHVKRDVVLALRSLVQRLAIATDFPANLAVRHRDRRRPKSQSPQPHRTRSGAGSHR